MMIARRYDLLGNPMSMAIMSDTLLPPFSVLACYLPNIGRQDVAGAAARVPSPPRRHQQRL